MFKVKDKIYLKLQDKIIEMKTILRQKRTWRFCNLGSFFKKIFMLNDIRKKIVNIRFCVKLIRRLFFSHIKNSSGHLKAVF